MIKNRITQTLRAINQFKSEDLFLSYKSNLVTVNELNYLTRP